MKRRISALLLSVALCLAMLCSSVFAAGASVTVSGQAGQTAVTVTASGLIPNKDYNMCAILDGATVLALFNLHTDAGGGFSGSVTTGPLTAARSLTVQVPDPSGQGAVTGGGTVSSGGGNPGGNPGTGTGGGSSGGGGGGGGGSAVSKAPKIVKNAGGAVTVASDNRTVTITPDAGYRVADVIVNGSSVGAVTEYVFSKASADNTLEVTFEKISAVTIGQFTDVAGHWAYNDIKRVLERGLFLGISDTEFAPDGPMTRAMLVTVLHRLAGAPSTGGAAFTDVAAGQWYANAVAWAADKKVVEGVGGGLFSPDGNITREELAVMLYRYAALVKGDVTVSQSLSGYPDAGGVHAWAEEAMAWAVGAKLVRGTDGGLLNPTGSATRAEVAAMLTRLMDFLD